MPINKSASEDDVEVDSEELLWEYVEQLGKDSRYLGTSIEALSFKKWMRSGQKLILPLSLWLKDEWWVLANWKVLEENKHARKTRSKIAQ